LIEWGSIYLQLAKDGGLPPHLQEVEPREVAFSPVLPEELAPARDHTECRDPRFGEDGAIELVMISTHG
jgi:hypothetical protein